MADPWPGTPGGATSPAWGGAIRLYVWVAIAAGSTMRWGQSATDNLDQGNVWGTGVVTPTPPAGRLWVDVSCDVRAVDTHIGGVRPDIVLSQAEAATCSLTLADPDRIYDPVNPDSPFQYGGRSRLAPGTPVWVWAEVLATPTTVTTWRIFTGSVDTWTEEWELHKSLREAKVVASDNTKVLVNSNGAEQSAIGAGETVQARINRILTWFTYTGATNLDTSAITLQGTTLAQSAWEMLGRAVDDEIGFLWIDRLGVLQFRNRNVWKALLAPVLSVGCPDGYDCVIDAKTVAGADEIRNTINASNTGGTMQTATSPTSVQQYGIQSYRRTDLGMQTNQQAADWAAYLLSLNAFPRPHIESVTLKPKFTPAMWPTLLGLTLITDRVKVQWEPPGEPLVETTGRVLGVDHSITRHTWEVKLALTMADLYGRVMHWGQHPYDNLTVGNVWV
jgi:hypothetical protein